MGRKIIWTKEALELLDGILTYWYNRNGSKNYSIKLSQLFQDNLKQIAKYPETGRKTVYLKVRYRIVKNYFIYYRFTAEEIVVVSLCDMRRDPAYIKSLLQ